MELWKQSLCGDCHFKHLVWQFLGLWKDYFPRIALLSLSEATCQHGLAIFCYDMRQLFPGFRVLISDFYYFWYLCRNSGKPGVEPFSVSIRRKDAVWAYSNFCCLKLKGSRNLIVMINPQKCSIKDLFLCFVEHHASCLLLCC